MSTITTIQGSDVISTSRTDINTNFANLNSDKIETSTLDTDTSLTANSDSKIATQKAVKAYVDSGGQQNASETVRGLVEEATAAEITAGTDTGATGAKLFVPPSKMNTRINALIPSVTSREIFVSPLSENANTFPFSVELGNFNTGSIDSSQYVFFIVSIPANFSSITSISLVCIPDATETIQWDTFIGIAASGEAYNASEASDLNRTLSVTSGQIKELNLLQGNLVAHIATVAANDYLGIKFNSDTTLLRPIGVKLVYTPATL